MQHLTDNDLVNLIKNNDKQINQAIERLNDKHFGIISKIAQSYYKASYAEIMSERYFLIFSAAMSFDFNRETVFSTHLANEVKWRCLKLKTLRSKLSMKETSIDDVYLDSFADKSTYSKIEEDYNNHIFSKVKLKISSIKDPRAKKIIEMRHFKFENKNAPWKIISKEVNMSIQGCINIYNKYIDNIKKETNHEYK
jgi:hypothetical protein